MQTLLYLRQDMLVPGNIVFSLLLVRLQRLISLICHLFYSLFVLAPLQGTTTVNAYTWRNYFTSYPWQHRSWTIYSVLRDPQQEAVHHPLSLKMDLRAHPQRQGMGARLLLVPQPFSCLRPLQWAAHSPDLHSTLFQAHSATHAKVHEITACDAVATLVSKTSLASAHQLIWGPESNDLNISIIIADCVPLPQGIKGCNSAGVEVLIKRPPDGDSRSQCLVTKDGHLRRRTR